MGSLGAEPVVTVLGRLARERRSGDLQVYSDVAVKCVYLDSGLIVFASSNRPEDRLGDRLVEQGRITGQQMIQARDQAEKQGQRFGAALVHLGLLSQHEISYEVGLQLEHIILSLFSLTEGVYFFDERDCAIPEDLRVPRPAPDILIRGARLMGDLGLVMGALPPLDTLVRLAESGPPRGQLHDVDLAVLEAASEEVSLQTILSRVQGRSTAVARACLGLLAAGHLERACASVEPSAESLSALDRLEETPRALSPESLGVGPQRHAQDAGGREEESRDPLESRHALPDLEPIPARPNENDEVKHESWRHPEPAPQNEAREDSEQLRKPLENHAESDDPMRKDRIDDLARDARLHVETKDWAGAIRLLCNLIEEAPDVVNYRVMLAKATSKFPSMQRLAEQHFAEAIRLAPTDPNVHHALGSYYRQNGRLARALEEFRETLRLDPQHPTVRREIEEIERQESKGSAKDILRRFLHRG